MILVEGLDNTGKSTLVARIAERYPQLKVRPSIGNRHNLDQIREAATQEADYPNRYMLSDRSRIISEYIYNPIIAQRQMAYSFTVYMELLAQFVQHTHLVILCYTDNLTLGDDREQLAGVAENMEIINVAYMRVSAMLSFLFSVQQDPAKSILISYNYQRTGDDWLWAQIDAYLERVSE